MLKVFLFILFCLPSLAFAETFHYSISQMGVKAGEATLSSKGEVEYKGEKLILIEFKADGFNFLDEELIYVDPTTYRPRYVERNLNIFGAKEKISEVYETGKIVITKTVKDKTTTDTLAHEGDVDNIYGFIYRYRKTGEFKVGEIVEIRLPTMQLSIKVVKPAKLKAAGKVYESLYLQSDPAKYKIWFDQSPDRLPLRIGGAVGIANTTMLLTQVSAE